MSDELYSFKIENSKTDSCEQVSSVNDILSKYCKGDCSSEDVFKILSSIGIPGNPQKISDCSIAQIIRSDFSYKDVLLEMYSREICKFGVNQCLGNISTSINKNRSGVWVAMTGSITVELEFLLTLDYLHMLYSSNEIDGVVFVTWKSELERKPMIRKALDDMGITTIGLDFPNVDISDDGFRGSYIIQTLQLDHALRAIPDDVLVIKCRTDFTFDWIRKICKSCIGSDSSYLNEQIVWGSLDQRYKIVTSNRYLSLIPPFRFSNTAFLAEKKMMIKLIQYERTNFSNFVVAPDNISFFFHNTEFPFLKKIIQNIKLDAISNYVDYGQDFELPDILLKFYALYFVILNKCYYHTEHWDPDNDSTGVSSLKQVFTRNLKPGFIVCPLNWAIVEKVIAGALSPDACYDKLLDEIHKVENFDYARSLKVTFEDYCELSAWGIKNLGLRPESWIYWRNKVMCMSGINEVRDCLSPDDASHYNFVREVAFDKGVFSLKHILPDLKKSNYSMYCKTLAMCVRNRDPGALKNAMIEFECQQSYSNLFLEVAPIFRRECEHLNVPEYLFRLLIVESSLFLMDEFNRTLNELVACVSPKRLSNSALESIFLYCESDKFKNHRDYLTILNILPKLVSAIGRNCLIEKSELLEELMLKYCLE